MRQHNWNRNARLLFSLGAVGLLSVASCNRIGRERAEGEKLIGFANLIRAGCDFCVEVEESIVREFAQAGYRLFAVDNAFDLPTGLANADAMVTKRVDLFIEFGPTINALPTIAAKMRSANPPIPVIFIDAPVPETEGTWYFGACSPCSGQMAGEWTLQWVKQNWGGQIDGIISTWTSDWDQETLGRLTEFMKVIQSYDSRWHMDSITRVDVKFEAEKSVAAYTAYLNAHPEAKRLIMYAPTNDVHGITAVAALESAGREADAVVVALGGESQARAHFRENPDGPFRMSVGYFPDRYGKLLARMARDILQGRVVPRKVFVEHRPITPDNVNREYPDERSD